MNLKKGDVIKFTDVSLLQGYEECDLKEDKIYYIKEINDNGFYLTINNVFITKDYYPYLERVLKPTEKISVHELHSLIDEIESRHVEWAIDSSLTSNNKQWFGQVMEWKAFYGD